MTRHTLKFRRIERRALRTLNEAKADVNQVNAALSAVSKELDKLQDPLSEELSNITAQIVGNIQRGTNVAAALNAARGLVGAMDAIAGAVSAAAEKNQEAFKSAMDTGGTLIDAYTAITDARRSDEEELGSDERKAITDAAMKVAQGIYSAIAGAMKGFSNVIDIAPEDVLDVPLLSFDRIVEITDELDRVDFENVAKSLEQEQPPEDSSAETQKGKASEEALKGVARKVALLWKAEGDELSFAQHLIDAGLDPAKLEKLTIS